MLDPAPAAGPPGTVRGVRVTPGDGRLTVRFRDGPRAEIYTTCWEEGGIVDAACAESISSPFDIDGLDVGREYGVVVYAENAEGVGATSAEASGVPGPPERPVSLRAEMAPEDAGWLYTRDAFSDERDGSSPASKVSRGRRSMCASSS